MLQEFKDFISKGSLIDIAVGFVMGVAFASVVSTFVGRIVNPLIGMIFNVSSLDTSLTFGTIDERPAWRPEVLEPSWVPCSTS